MHVTRPKSSKGRSRPAVNSSLYGGDADSIQGTPESQACSRPDRTLRSRSQPTMWEASHLSQDQVLHMLQHAPAAPPQSLNKYKVLPSIERRRSEASAGRSLDEMMPKLNLTDDAMFRDCGSDGDTRADGDLPVRPKPPPDPAPGTTKEASLLLAIRAPCGRRFQQHFEPADTLLTVRASAESKYGVKYGEAFIETMDVPRRTFADLNMTLAQCGIFNRSVLCISLSNGSDVVVQQ
ncbi:UBX domain-containing protein 10 [Mugil cephalus]|uniref:UBX domain-containing protein 10 n=1 Tax=Mugil cephalus TaxID=48193 RepID=UPI001FB64C10|nr:UBX domain-containing protein 10 [Mugil cephalus]XP_047465854.1 UBX domain-containing protein 10 [Mugil cephalus]